MERTIKCLILLLFSFVIANPVYAATYLMSAPLTRGDNGDFNCSCVNISKKDMEFEVMIYDSSFSGWPALATVVPGGILKVSTTASASPPKTAYCKVQPFSQKVTLTPKTLLCTFSVIDSNETPQITIPVDTKTRR